MTVDMKSSTEVVASILSALGYDPDDQHFARTPERWIMMLAEFQAPSLQESPQLILGTEFEETYGGIIVVDNIPFSSLCAHHLAPFSGVAHVGYIPSGRVVGISKLARITEFFTHRITVQETATRLISESIDEVLKPKGVAVVLEAQHTCMSVRGIRSIGAKTTTASLTGIFIDNAHGCRTEFYNILARSK